MKNDPFFRIHPVAPIDQAVLEAEMRRRDRFGIAIQALQCPALNEYVSKVRLSANTAADSAELMIEALVVGAFEIADRMLEESDRNYDEDPTPDGE